MASVATLAVGAGVLQPSRTWAQSAGSKGSKKEVKTTEQTVVHVQFGGLSTKPTQAEVDAQALVWATTWPNEPVEPKPRNPKNPVTGMGRPEFIGKPKVTAYDPPKPNETKNSINPAQPKLSARKMEDGLWYYVYEYIYVVDKVAPASP
jgi:hypothetical protein